MIQNRYTLKEVSARLSVPVRVLQQNIEDGLIPFVQTEQGVMLSEDTVDVIRKQKEALIGICDFLDAFASDTVSTSTVKDVRKCADYMTENLFWGLEVQYPETVLFDRNRRNILYLKREDVEVWFSHMERFLHEFGKTSGDLLEEYLTHRRFDRDIQSFLGEYFADYTDPITDVCITAVASILTYPKPLANCTDEDIQTMIKAVPKSGSKKMIVSIVNSYKEYTETSYRYIVSQETSLIVPGSRTSKAYSLEVMNELRIYFFNEEYIRDHRMLERAFEDSFRAEQWLYSCIISLVSWRPGNVIQYWRYLDLQKEPRLFPQIDRTRIPDQVLGNELPETLYQEICIYIVDLINHDGNIPSKTARYGPGSLHVAIGHPAVQWVLGRILLACEYHHIQTGTGRMMMNRRSEYTKRIRLMEFFGDDIKQTLDGRNLIPTALVKTQSQLIERISQRLGNGPVQSHLLASYSRSHTSPDSMRHYLSDRSFFGDTPESVINEMFERGAFSCMNVMALKSVLPNEFMLLPEKIKTKVLQSYPVTPLDQELTIPIFDAVCKLDADMRKGDPESIKRTLKLMHEIMQGFHEAKHIGCGCVSIALGYGCQNPGGDCLLDACQFCVATRMALPALYRVLKDLNEQYEQSEDPKVKAKIRAVLTKKMVPMFKDLIRELLRENGTTENVQQIIQYIKAEDTK